MNTSLDVYSCLIALALVLLALSVVSSGGRL